MAQADVLYFIVSPDPDPALGARHYQDNAGPNARPYFYVKFGDGGGNHAAYRRANPDFRLVENPGVNPDSVITFPDPGSGVNVTQRYAKFLEKTLLLRFDKAHGGRSEWYKVSPTGGLTIQQLAARLSTLLTSFGTADLENNSNAFIRQFEDSMQNSA
ncbi:hypothetical protein DFH08DRAFT_883160 [Mycena albidolilacea]|uniref:Uncharacterized protein n=1 Tax=Mycena albidolilacea TaxID=1033008 RepID=A0AAD6ZM38_9AGAR|nr:hypothetical protein DFH08DRAFT_883160 [Mycena albidolilacea]